MKKRILKNIFTGSTSRNGRWWMSCNHIIQSRRCWSRHFGFCLNQVCYLNFMKSNANGNWYWYFLVSLKFSEILQKFLLRNCKQTRVAENSTEFKSNQYFNRRGFNKIIFLRNVFILSTSMKLLKIINSSIKK